MNDTETKWIVVPIAPDDSILPKRLMSNSWWNVRANWGIGLISSILLVSAALGFPRSNIQVTFLFSTELYDVTNTY